MTADGMPQLTSTSLEETPFYMEAELNSPMAVLAPGETYTMDSQWFPTRASHAQIDTVTDAGLVIKPLTAVRAAENIEISGGFGVFFPGELRVFMYDAEGTERYRSNPYARKMQLTCIKRLRRPRASREFQFT